MTYTDKTVDEIVSEMWAANQDAQTKLILGTAELSRRAKLAEKPVDPDLPDKPIEPAVPELPPKELIEPKEFTPGMGDTVTHNSEDSFDLDDAAIVCNGRSGVILHSKAPEVVLVDIENVALTQTVVAPHWGLCLNHFGGEITDVSAVGLGHDVGDGRVRDGHGIYGKLLGNVTVNHYTATECAGQAIQFVTRPHEGPVPDALDVYLNGVTAYNCSSMPSRGSAMLALYCASTGLGTYISCGKLDLRSDYGLPAKPGQDASTRGAIQVWADGHEETGAYFYMFLCKHLHIEFAKGDRFPLDFKDCRKVQIDKITGSVTDSHVMYEGLPVLVNIEPPPEGTSFEVSDIAFPFVVRHGSEHHAVHPGETLTIS